MYYVMVTNWDRHWDGLGQQETYYTTGMFRQGMDQGKLQDNTKTYFIRREKQTKHLEKSWLGSVYDIRQDKREANKIYFKVKVEREIECPTKYEGYTEGWWCFEEKEVDDSLSDPKFFSLLQKTQDWHEFERYTHLLIKSLGIHVHHAFSPNQQRGLPDGFFKFRGFAVLYDCTLASEFEKEKLDQMKNFCNQLKSGSINFSNKTVDITDCKKSVWIITRSGKPRLIKNIDQVTIREVPIQVIIDLYRNRLNTEMDEDRLESELRQL